MLNCLWPEVWRETILDEEERGEQDRVNESRRLMMLVLLAFEGDAIHIKQWQSFPGYAWLIDRTTAPGRIICAGYLGSTEAMKMKMRLPERLATRNDEKGFELRRLVVPSV